MSWPEFSFRQVRDEDASGVHDERDADLCAHLPEDVADDRALEELTELVLDGGDGLALEAGIVARVFVLPELPDERVLDLSHDPRAIAGVGQEPVHAQESGVRAVEQRGDGVVEDVFESRSPRITPDALERADDAGGDQVPVVRSDVREQVQADGEVEVAGVEVDQVVGPSGRDVVQKFLGKIAVRIDQADAVAGGDVLDDAGCGGGWSCPNRSCR